MLLKSHEHHKLTLPAKDAHRCNYYNINLVLKSFVVPCPCNIWLSKCPIRPEKKIFQSRAKNRLREYFYSSSTANCIFMKKIHKSIAMEKLKSLNWSENIYAALKPTFTIFSMLCTQKCSVNVVPKDHHVVILPNLLLPNSKLYTEHSKLKKHYQARYNRCF